MSGPWSDLPPPSRPDRRPQPLWRPRLQRGSREPFINNWRGLAILAFLVFVAPVLVRWIIRVVTGLATGAG